MVVAVTREGDLKSSVSMEPARLVEIRTGDSVTFVNPLFKRKHPVLQRMVVNDVRQMTPGLVFITEAGHLLRRTRDGVITLVGAFSLQSILFCP